MAPRTYFKSEPAASPSEKAGGESHQRTSEPADIFTTGRSRKLRAARLMSLLALLSLGCTGEAQTVRLMVSNRSAPSSIDERFVSFTFDTSAIVASDLDLASPRLRQLARNLSPAYLRIGGTNADRTYFDDSSSPIDTPPPGYAYVLSRSRLDDVCDFADATGLKVLFNINAGPGPRAEDGSWQDDNARALMTYAVERACPIEVWEFGNEIGAFPLEHGFALDGASYARDFARFMALRDELNPEARVAGPAVAYWPVWGEVPSAVLPGFMQASPEIDIVTWHYYPQQSSRCPIASRAAEDETMLNPAHLDEVSLWAEEVEGLAAASGAEIWLGETGHAQCGGEPGLSDRFASSFWWLDQLGQIAERGQPVVLRQALIGGSYQLVRRDGFIPTPDYFASWLFREHMHGEVMSTETRALSADTDASALRSYATCAASPQGTELNLLLLNIETSAREVELSTGNRALEAWIVTASGLRDENVRVNGQRAEVDGEGVPIATAPRIIRERLRLPARSYAFVRVASLEERCELP